MEVNTRKRRSEYLISVAAGEGADRRLNCPSSGVDVALQTRGVVARHDEYCWETITWFRSGDLAFGVGSCMKLETAVWSMKEGLEGRRGVIYT